MRGAARTARGGSWAPARAPRALDPRKLGYFVAVRALIGEGNDQYAALRALVPSKVRGGQLSIQYTGNLPQRIRGEALSKRVAR